MVEIIEINKTRIQSIFSKFSYAEAGNIGILFALSMTPVMILTGMTTDYGLAVRSHSHLQNALDSAALAGAQGTHLTTNQRIEIAANIFETNTFKSKVLAGVIPEISVNKNGHVSVNAAVNVPTSFLKLARVHTIPISAKSSATAVNPRPICLLALNKTMDKAIEVGGTGSLQAIDCAVQANSTSDIAIYAQGSSTAEAAAFCSPGGYEGNNFSPTPKRCYSVEDPYKDMEWPVVGACNHNNKRVRRHDGHVTLHPGTYCGGIHIGSRAEVTLSAGIYVMKDGDFDIGSHAEVSGSEVTIYLTGNNISIDIHGGATVDLSAPTEGDYTGFLFVQDPESNPGEVNTINGGGSIKMVGTLYFPTQGIRINGNGMLGINSPMMPIIADHFIVNGNGIFEVDVDEANMDIELPMTNDGAVVMN